MNRSGWVLLPVGIEDDADPEDNTSFEFDNGKAYYEPDWGGAWGYIDSDEAPTWYEALEKMRRLDI